MLAERPSFGVTPSPVLVVLAMAVIYLVWGAAFLAIALTVETMPPLLSMALRFVVAGGVLLTWSSISPTVSVRRTTRTQVVGSFTVGALLIAGGIGLVALAAERISSGMAAMLYATMPLWLALMERFAEGRLLAARRLVAVLLGLIGVGLLGAGGIEDGTIELIGALLVFGAALSWATGTIFLRRASLPQGMALATGLQLTAGGLVLLVAGLLTGELGRHDAAGVSTTSVLALLWLTVFNSILGFLSYSWLLQHLSAMTVATHAYVNPAVAVVLGVVILGEQVSWPTAVGAMVVIAAVVLIVTEGQRSSDTRSDAGVAKKALS